VNVSVDASALVTTTRRRPVVTSAAARGPGPASALEQFEEIYRRNVDALVGYFARRCGDAQTVADLTSESFVRAMTGFAGFNPARGTERAWLFGIAARVFAQHCERSAHGRVALERLGADRGLGPDEMEELAQRIDAERAGAALMRRYEALPPLERAAVELVDLEGLSPKEAALALGVSRVALRQRLSRARSRLRKESNGND
jgi:RNA polymerase sigma factor (sigma-70 family)